jgi:hypothetical protein
VTGPDLQCNGNLQWNEINPGSKVQGSLTIENIGSDGSSLNWKINSNPDWGVWSFSPDNGNDLKPEEGPITVNVEITAPNEKNKEFTGQVTIINKDNPLDICEIEVVLITPKPRSYKTNLLFQHLSIYLMYLEKFCIRIVEMLIP